MSEENIRDENGLDVGLNIFSDGPDAAGIIDPARDLTEQGDPETWDPAADQDPATPGAAGLDQLSGSGPDDYPGAAENDPDNWRDDPLVEEESESVDGYRSEQYLEDQTDAARYESGHEQIPPDEPTIGQASADVDFGETPTGDEADGSDDDANFGGSPLGRFGEAELDPEELEG